MWLESLTTVLVKAKSREVRLDFILREREGTEWIWNAILTF